MATNVIPTSEQINQTKRSIDAYIQTIDQHPDRRTGAYPYYLFHEPGQPIQGTVILFHGLSNRPHQMRLLASYLFENGFNVYQSTIAGHAYINPAKNWCQIDLKPEYVDRIKQKIQNDPILQEYLKNFANNPFEARPGDIQQRALLARLVHLEPELIDIARAIELPNDPNFDKYYISSHLRYLTDAQERLAELDAMPGEVYTIGLSVGGAVALGLAASRPDRIRAVVAYAPLLKVIESRRRYVNLAGPLDIYEFGWDPNLRFPVGCFTAADRFGSTLVLGESSMRSLKTIPTFLVTTENDDAADLATNKAFYQQLGGARNLNEFYLYLAQDLVPHPMVDPEEVSQNMSNRFWKSLYQETFRFLAEGIVNVSHLSVLGQDPSLPAVPDR
jgi:pimeloyl-ACP methyl ester carboxylesterase